MKGLPLAQQRILARNDNVDFARPLLDRIADFAQALLERSQPGGKTGCDRSYRDPCPGQGLYRMGDHGGIDADGAGRQPHVANAQFIENVLPNGLPRLVAQPSHATRRIVSRQRRKVDALDRTQQPGSLILLLYGSRRRQSRRAALCRRAIDLDVLEPASFQ